MQIQGGMTFRAVKYINIAFLLKWLFSAREFVFLHSCCPWPWGPRGLWAAPLQVWFSRGPHCCGKIWGKQNKTEKRVIISSAPTDPAIASRRVGSFSFVSTFSSRLWHLATSAFGFSLRDPLKENICLVKMLLFYLFFVRILWAGYTVSWHFDSFKSLEGTFSDSWYSTWQVHETHSEHTVCKNFAKLLLVVNI